MMYRIESFIKRLFRIVNPPPVINCDIKLVHSQHLLSGRCALITGGTSGIGYSIAKSFLLAGSTVIITGRNYEKLNLAISQLKMIADDDSKVMGYILDSAAPETFEKAFNQMKEMVEGVEGLHNIDILVNNAGVNAPRMPNATIDDYNMVMDTNLRGAFFLSQLFGKYMVSQNIKGNILNIASASSLRPADSAYTLSKWGLRGLTLGMAKSLGNYGITVNGIAPGPTATPMMKKNGDTNMSHDRIPLGRYVTPEEIAAMAVMLVSDMGRSVMGDLVYMTGGAGILTYDDVKYSF